MDTDKLQQIQAHARAIAALLYDETAPEQLTTMKAPRCLQRGISVTTEGVAQL